MFDWDPYGRNASLPAFCCASGRWDKSNPGMASSQISPKIYVASLCFWISDSLASNPLALRLTKFRGCRDFSGVLWRDLKAVSVAFWSNNPTDIEPANVCSVDMLAQPAPQGIQAVKIPRTSAVRFQWNKILDIRYSEIRFKWNKNFK